MPFSLFWLRLFAYRCWLLVTTVILSLLLLKLQALLDSVPLEPTTWRLAVQWAELSWLIPVPLAITLWMGWFIFAEAARPSPALVEVPWVADEGGFPGFAPSKPVKLVFRFVTRGDNLDVLSYSVRAVQQSLARYASIPPPYEIQIVSDYPLSLGRLADNTLHVYVVPSDYVTQKRSRFKARALTYLQEQVQLQQDDWYIYLDEESVIDETLLVGIYRFIWRCILSETDPQRPEKKKRSRRLIGQGVILYQGGNWFFRGADALRTADDLGRFRLQYALGMPIFGIHGSFIVTRGTDDAHLSFDVGPTNSFTEDAAWALHAWAQGFRFAWIEGYLHEQPPQRIGDFVRQRSRWLSGIRLVLCDTSIPPRYRLCLGIFTVLWQLEFLPILVAVVALFVHASPFAWMRIPADFAWATFVLAYLHGIDVQARHGRYALQEKMTHYLDQGSTVGVAARVTPKTTRGLRTNIRLFIRRACSWPLVLCLVWYSILEAAGVLYSLWPKQDFFVIKKPILAAKQEIVEDTRTVPRV
jgi:beta-1,4-mannosyltransferase